MHRDETRTTLKRGAKRSVDHVGGPQGEVVKRFHSPGPIDRWRDGARARSEYEISRTVHERGLTVPRPIAVRRTAQGWEIASEWIEGAVALSDVLAGRAAWPAPPELLARALGELLAHAHAIGLDHPDLHAGNVLVAPDARAWLVDLHRARLAATLTAATLRRDLVQLAADTRERLAPTLRARIFATWRSRLPEPLSRTLPAQADLGAEVEDRARERRRATLWRARLRWTRNSSACRIVSIGGRRGFASADLDERAIAACADPAAHEADLARSHRTTVVVADRPLRDVRAAWYAAVRSCDHALRCAQPLLFVEAPHARAVFGLPAGVESLEHTLRRAPRTLRRAIATSLGDLAGALFDRGLALPHLAYDSLATTQSGDVWIARPATIRAIDPESRALDRADGPWFDFLRTRSNDRDERELFARAFVGAQRSGSRTRARLTAHFADASKVERDG